MEAPGTAPGSEWFIATVIYFHSRRTGTPNIGRNFGEKQGPKALNKRGTRGNTFGLMSLSCGFATNSTVPEVRRVRIGSRRCMNFRQQAVRIARPIANRSGAATHQSKVAICGPVAGPDCSFAFHLPFGSEAFWVLLALSEETR
ncbi:hypothetical protein V1294_002460 [Bradyrhizobium sp. AZCC 1678]